MFSSILSANNSPVKVPPAEILQVNVVVFSGIVTVTVVEDFNKVSLDGTPGSIFIGSHIKEAVN